MSNHARRTSFRRHPVTKAAGASGTILTLGAALVAVTPGTAGAATIIVDSPTDDGSGGLTLREAIDQANLTPAEDDTITFAPALNGQTITLTSQIDIDDELNIQGPGAAQLTVSGNDGNRIFYIDTGAGAVTVSGLTLTAGSTGGDGGAIYSGTGGAVTLTNLVVENSYAEGDGGGVSISGAASVSVTGTTFRGNDSAEDGGGLQIYDVDGAVNITASTFDQNYADNYGGGLALYAIGGATTVAGTFTDNDATQGGGISVYNVSGTTSISGTITGNEASYGGGIDVYNSDGAVTITTATIADNTVDESGGGLRVKSAGDITISRSTISGNYASVDGGGVYAYDAGELTITNSTVSGNEAGSDGGGISFAYTESAGQNLVLTHATVTANDAGGDGGGLYLGDDATIDHTIISGNPTGGDVEGLGAAGLSNSLIGGADLGGVTVTDGGNNDFSTDAVLGPLAANGGPTQTHALLTGSPALDSGDPGFAPPPATDQRGEARVSNEVIDKGAFEAQVDEPTEPPPSTGGTGATPVPAQPNFTG